MKVGGGENWPIKLRLEGYPRSAIVPAARQNRQPGFDDVDKGANLALTFCLRAQSLLQRLVWLSKLWPMCAPHYILQTALTSQTGCV